MERAGLFDLAFIDRNVAGQGLSGEALLIGMGAIVLDGAVIGERSIIGAGALVTGGTIIPPGSLVLGSPGKVVRTLSLDEQAKVKTWAEKYVKGSRIYLERH
jgi:carbonic anhydrase/acetyltransferase-like protein (isoleucine patch superfamily)